MTAHRFFGRRLLGLAACLLGLAGAPPAVAAKAYDVYVVPQFSADETHRAWSPVLARIGDQLGITLNLRISKSIPEFEQAFLEGRPDLAFVNPYHAVMARAAAGYEPIVCDASQQLTGILVVRKDSPVTALRELEGREIAFPAPNAFGASLYMRALLKEQEQLNIVPRYAKTHSNVFRQVANGAVAAGGAIRQTLHQETPELQAQLRILYETPAVLPHPLIAHPRIPARLQQKIQQAFIRLGGEAGGSALLAPTQIAEPRAVAYRDYAPLERLGLGRYVVNSGQ